MTDRELLERAAKAAGIDACWINPDDAEFDSANEGMWLNGERSPDNSKFWNPLTDDGDALRLAVKLNIVIWEFNQYNCALTEVRYGKASGEYTECGDRYAATRRAIVRAAAEIGKGMP
jgi:hypothetical protein